MKRFEWDVERCPDPAPGPEQLLLEREAAREQAKTKGAPGEAERQSLLRAIHSASWKGRPCAACPWRCPGTGWCVLPRCLALPAPDKEKQKGAGEGLREEKDLKKGGAA